MNIRKLSIFPIGIAVTCIATIFFSHTNSVSARPAPHPLASGDYYIERVGAHCEWLLKNQKLTSKWSAIRSSARKDAGDDTSSSYYQQRIAEHCQWLLTNTGLTSKWNVIDDSARKDAGIDLYDQ